MVPPISPTCPTGARFDDGAGGDNEVQRTMLELINQLDGFDPRGGLHGMQNSNILLCVVFLMTHSFSASQLF